MKLHSPQLPSANVFNAYGQDHVEVNGVRFDNSILVVPDRPVIAWPVASFDALTSADFDVIAALDPELVVFGSGTTLRFPHPRLLAPLSMRGIGVETMGMHAACRTYNILMAEGRKVVAAVLIDAAQAGA